MADNTTTVSGTTVAPDESASQVGRPSAGTAKPKGSGRQKRSSKNSKDKDAPQGAVQVQPGGQSRTGKTTPVQTATIPLSGWGEIDLTSHRNDIEPTWAPDAQPFDDLVHTTYQGLQSRFSSGGKHIPFGLFNYYCMQMFWYRVLFLHRRNGNVLTTDEKNFLNIMDAGEEFHIPSHIAQYLGNLGNFMQGNETFFFRLPRHSFGDAGNDALRMGFFSSLDPANRATADMWYKYCQLPSPGVFVTYTCNEAYWSTPNPVPANLHTLARIEPQDAAWVDAHPTNNIVGWTNDTLAPHHGSWRSTYANLGWTLTTLPSDAQTAFSLSTSTMRWVSDRLSTLKDFKVFSSRQLTLSTQGNPVQAYWLATETDVSNLDQRPPVADVGDNKLNGCLRSDLALNSRFAMDSKTLCPAYAFGYRLARSRVVTEIVDGQPQFANRTNYDPWLFTNAPGNAYVDPGAAWMANLNEHFNFGSQRYINIPRFSTHALPRSAALDAAIVLSDTK